MSSRSGLGGNGSGRLTMPSCHVALITGPVLRLDTQRCPPVVPFVTIPHRQIANSLRLRSLVYCPRKRPSANLLCALDSQKRALSACLTRIPGAMPPDSLNSWKKAAPAAWPTLTGATKAGSRCAAVSICHFPGLARWWCAWRATTPMRHFPPRPRLRGDRHLSVGRHLHHVVGAGHDGSSGIV